MPRMLPKLYFAEATNNPSDAEEEIFNRFSNDKTIDDWWILHSYHIVDHVVQKEGEVDFIVFIPSLGVVTIEVKGHREIKYEEGLWYFNKNHEPEKKSPLTQAKENMWSLMDLIKQHEKKPTGFGGVPWTHICIFPFAKFKFTSAEWYDWQIIDADKLNKEPLPSLIHKALLSKIEIENKNNLTEQRVNSAVSEQDQKRYKNRNYQIKKNNLFTPKDIEQIIKILRPNIESISESYDQRIERINNEIEVLTPEQENVLESARNNDNFLITGPAGSGKTLLATEICNIFGQENLKVLYLCFNKGLMYFLKNKLSTDKFEIKTFHSLLGEISSSFNLKIENYENEEEYFDELYESAMEALRLNNIKYDVIVIDEFQDIAIEKNMYLIDRLLTGGFSSGKWYFFGDFEKQNLFNNNYSTKDILKEMGHNHFELSLRRNCRNTPDVAEEIERLVSLNPPYQRPFLRRNGIAEPLFMEYSDQQSQLSNLQESIEDLLHLGYDKSEILILSPLSKDSAVKKLNNTNSGLKFYEYNYQELIQSEAGPFYSTIYKYKGLEHNVIILTDIESHAHLSSVNDELVSLIYTGLTRSLETYIMHVNKKVIEAGLIS